MEDIKYKEEILSHLTKFYNQHMSDLLNPEQIVETSKKIWNLSNFASKEAEIERITKNEKIIFAFPEGILFTDSKFHTFDSDNGHKNFEIQEFLNVNANHKTWTKYGKFQLNGNTLITEGTKKFNLELYDELKMILKPLVDKYIIEPIEIAEQEKEQAEEKLINYRIERLESLRNNIRICTDLAIPEIVDYKKLIINKESEINLKGDDDKLFAFLKIDSFLRDFRSQIISDIQNLNETFDFDLIKDKIIGESENKDLSYLIAKLEGKGLDRQFDKMFEYSDSLVYSIENQIKTLEYYLEISKAMVFFYLNDKKIIFFEIYEAFDRLGVFDSTWQKNVLSKLESIDIRLSNMNDK
jgi:hypothetical protein